MNPTTTYLERTASMSAAAAAAEIDIVATIFNRRKERIDNIADDTVGALNDTREMGIRLQSACGHEQMKPSYWKSHCEGKLPFDFESAKMFISTARKMPKPAATIADAVQFFQSMLISDNRLELPQRTLSGTASAFSPVERFCNEFVLMLQPWKKIDRERPIEKWDAPTVSKVLSETEWIVTVRERAERRARELRGAK